MVEVVVPTRDRPAALAACLDALARQREPVRVLVADDAGSAETLEVVSRARDRGLDATVATAADRDGPAAMRNLGAGSTRSEVVCFTDDDCEPAPDWAATLTAGARDAGCAAGLTVAADRSERWACASQAIINALQLHSLDPASGRLGFAPTSNLAVRRDLLASLPFDESFPTAAGEDREWCARAAAAGAAPRYVPAALVYHRPPLRARDFARQQWRYGRGGTRFRGEAPRRAAGDGVITAPRLAGISPGFQARLARLAIGNGPGVLARAELGQAIGLIGALAGLGAALKDRRASRSAPRGRRDQRAAGRSP